MNFPKTAVILDLSQLGGPIVSLHCTAPSFLWLNFMGECLLEAGRRLDQCFIMKRVVYITNQEERRDYEKQWVFPSLLPQGEERFLHVCYLFQPVQGWGGGWTCHLFQIRKNSMTKYLLLSLVFCPHSRRTVLHRSGPCASSSSSNYSYFLCKNLFLPARTSQNWTHWEER